MYPVLFQIPVLGWPVFSYGVMLGLSIIVGWYLTMYLAERNGLPRKTMGSCYFWGIIGALAGARLLYLVTNPEHLTGPADMLNLRQGGLVAYGGFLGALGTCAVFCRIKKINLWAWADATAAPIVLGLAITRVGCFLYGCCFGRRVTDDDPAWVRSIALRFPNWAVRFPHMGDAAGGCQHDVEGSPAFMHHVRNYGLDSAAAASFEIFPSQLADTINGLIAFGLLLLLLRVRRFHGTVFLGFAVYYGLTRFVLETVRDDAQRGTFGPAVFGPVGYHGQLTTSQIIALITVTAAVAGLVWMARRARRDPDAAMALGSGAVAVSEVKPGRPRSRRGARKR
jgi:phosphatidylglycerol:prolipoprotein diacylglycerol transferase